MRRYSELEAEIRRLTTVEAALVRSKRAQKVMLKESLRMQEQLRELSHSVLQVQEEERRRISLNLHDEIAQSLVGINFHLVALGNTDMVTESNLRAAIIATQDLVEQSVASVHRFAMELRPTLLDTLGLIPALRAHLKALTEHSDLRIEMIVTDAFEELTGTQATVLYRIAQAALSNTIQHAEATEVVLYLSSLHASVRMEIRDNGKSFSVDRVLHANKEKRLGLIGMRERAEMVGGTFTITSKPGEGTMIGVQIPLHEISSVRLDRPCIS